MSQHIYIAKNGFKDNPISLDAWVEAARHCDELLIEEQKNRLWPGYRIVMKANTDAYLDRTPYGLIHAQDPSKEQVAVMFKLAGLLGAEVYSEDLERYLSVEDWEQKTQSYRSAMDERRATYRTKRRKRIILITLFVIACALIGYVFKLD